MGNRISHHTEAALEKMYAADKGGRPPIGPRVHVALPDEMLERVDTLAQRTGRTRADAIRWLVYVGLSNPDVKTLAE